MNISFSQLYTQPQTFFAAAWAKSDAETGSWMPLVTHCLDSGAVAHTYWDKFLSAKSRRILEQWLDENDCQNSEDLAQKLATFLISSHDIGKISPAFAQQVEPLKQFMIEAGFDFPPNLTKDDRRRAPHSAVSEKAIIEWLQKKFPASKKRNIRTLACISGGHHGIYQTKLSLPFAQPGTRGAGASPIWQEAREQLLEVLQKLAGLSDPELEKLVEVGLNQASQIFLTAFTIVCDWIASNADLFPYPCDEKTSLTELAEIEVTQLANMAIERSESGLRKLNLPLPWIPKEHTSDEELFISRFNLPEGASPRPVQKQVMQLARRLKRPSLIIVEAPTGEGKTESAFSAAEILAKRFGLGGVFVGLPTQATSNAMFSRTLAWLKNSIEEDGLASINLMHGKAQFNEEFEQLQDWGLKNIGGDDGAANGTLQAHWWLSGRKKSILADFVVGTIDQVLMAALVSKHVVLRMFGLANKVVILDEVHASDEYMQVYLDGALHWLGALGVPVIALSATLPPARRSKMLAAYEKGRNGKIKDESDSENNFASLAQNATGYPLISVAERDIWPITVPPSGRSSKTRIEFLPEDPAFLVDKVLEETREGGCVAVIHNTVGRAQQTYQGLKPILGNDVLLLHSRFITTDRIKLEENLVHSLGPGSDRPKRLVVVSTQVIEQSLDVDFDLMISDLAPIDSIIQRIGRLHRHSRSNQARPKNMVNPRLLLTGFRLDETGVPELDKGSERVYGPALLLRSLATLFRHLEQNDSLASPDDVPYLVKHAYCDRLVPPPGWESIWEKAEDHRAQMHAKLQQQAKTGLIPLPKKGAHSMDGWACGSQNHDEEFMSQAVRAVSDSIEVVAVVRDKNGIIHTLDWLETHDGAEPVDLTCGISKGFAKKIAQCTVRLPAWLARGSLGDKVVAELEQDGIPSWQDSYWLKGALPLVFEPDFSKRICDYIVKYDRTMGLTVEREEK